MAKKFGRFMLFSALAGAAAAGTYYCLKNKNNTSEDSLEDFDDCDGFDKDLEDEDFSADSPAPACSKNRSHMPIDIDNAKEKIGEKVIETLDKTKEKIEHFNVSEKIDKAKELIVEMTTPPSEPVYTQMDISAAPSDSETDAVSETVTSVSETYADSSESGNSEDFFDDSKEN